MELVMAFRTICTSISLSVLYLVINTTDFEFKVVLSNVRDLQPYAFYRVVHLLRILVLCTGYELVKTDKVN